MALTGAQLLTKIDEIDSALEAIYSGGQVYSIPGRGKVERADVPDLLRLKNHYRKQYYQTVKGYYGRATADFRGL